MVDNFSFIDNTLAGSAYPNQIEDVEEYISAGISHVISLTPNLPLVSKYLDNRSIAFHHFPVYATPDDKQLSEFKSLLHEIVENNEKVVVHCQYGQERTGIFLATYLIEVKGEKVKEAIQLIKAERPGSLQTSHAQHFLLDKY